MFLDKEYGVKVGDFGSATSYDLHAVETLGGYGTPSYLAPEVLLKKDYSPASDKWASWFGFSAA